MCGTRNRRQRIFQKCLDHIPYLENVHQKVNFFWLWWNWDKASFLQIFHNIWDTSGSHCSQVFYSLVRGDLKNISLHTSYITSNCPENIWLETERHKEKIAQRHLLKLKKDLNCKLLLDLIIATQLNSLSIFLSRYYTRRTCDLHLWFLA